jgi:Acetyltransferase (GNAT) family
VGRKLNPSPGDQTASARINGRYSGTASEQGRRSDGTEAGGGAQLLAHDGKQAFVAEDDGRIVGYTAALVRGDHWFFSALFVDPAHGAAASAANCSNSPGVATTVAASRSPKRSSPSRPASTRSTDSFR